MGVVQMLFTAGAFVPWQSANRNFEFKILYQTRIKNKSGNYPFKLVFTLFPQENCRAGCVRKSHSTAFFACKILAIPRMVCMSLAFLV
jgi:hypothetical protein